MNTDVFSNSVLLADTQLWYLNDNQKSFPLLVTLAEYPIGSGYRRQIVEPALPPKPPELAFLHAHLDPYMIPPGSRSLWVLSGESTVQLLQKAPGITPSYYYRGWDDAPSQSEAAPAPKPEPSENPLPTDAEEFLRYFHSTSNVFPLEDLRVLWHMLSAAIFHWLYQRRKPVDFGCVKLVAMPYRKDWMACLWAANPKIRTLFLRSCRKPLLLQSDWYEHLIHPVLTAVNRHNNTVCWSVHAIETKCWMDSVAAGETHLKGCLGLQWYGQHWVKNIRKYEKYIFEAFEAYLEQTSLPHGRVAQSGNGLAPIFIPQRASNGGFKANPVLCLANPNSFDDDMEPVTELERQNAELQALPSVPSPIPNMRDARRDLPEYSSPST